MRFSTARTPRVISCFEEAGDFLALPRGCLEPLEELLEGLGIELELTDERSGGTGLDARFTGELEPAQAKAAQGMLGDDLGVLCAPPGSGKTVIATQMIAARGRSTLVLVHRKPLLDQWKERLSQFLDVDPGAIGTIGGGRRKPTGLIDVAMIQSLARRDALEESHRQETEMPSTTQITAIDFVIVPTRDFETAKAFYRDTLGLEEGPQWGDMPAQEFETGNLTIAVMDPTAFGQEFKPSAGSIVMRVEDFDAAKSDLEGKGVTFVTDKIDSGVCHQAYFLDPDGNSLGIHHRYKPR